MTTEITAQDVIVLNNELKATYNVEHSEIVGARGMEFLEGWCHEMAHVMDYGYSADNAADTAQNVSDVKQVLIDNYKQKNMREAADDNEVHATAITMIALTGFHGYKSSDSEGNMYGNVIFVSRVKSDAMLAKALTSPRIKRLGEELRNFLLEALDSGREHQVEG